MSIQFRRRINALHKASQPSAPAWLCCTHPLPGQAMLIILAISLSGAAACGAAPWAIPHTPRVPHAPQSVGGVSLSISIIGSTTIGNGVGFRVTLVNHSARPFHPPAVADLLPPWFAFPGTWCWRLPRVTPAPLTRYVGSGFRGGAEGSRIPVLVPAHASYTFLLPLALSHIFDLSVPGKYEVQLAGLGLISNVVKFRVPPPRRRPTGPAIRKFTVAPLVGVTWGKPWHGLEASAYVNVTPWTANPTARVQILFRCVGRHPAAVSLTGNPQIDFRQRRVTGPFHTAAQSGPAPLTAYGKLLAKADRTISPSAKVYTLEPGTVYAYWRPLVLNREFDLSLYGPYRFTARLGSTSLRTAPETVYVGVRPRRYGGEKRPQ